MSNVRMNFKFDKSRKIGYNMTQELPELGIEEIKIFVYEKITLR